MRGKSCTLLSWPLLFSGCTPLCWSALGFTDTSLAARCLPHHARGVCRPAGSSRDSLDALPRSTTVLSRFFLCVWLFGCLHLYFIDVFCQFSSASHRPSAAPGACAPFCAEGRADLRLRRRSARVFFFFSFLFFSSLFVPFPFFLEFSFLLFFFFFCSRPRIHHAKSS